MMIRNCLFLFIVSFGFSSNAQQVKCDTLTININEFSLKTISDSVRQRNYSGFVKFIWTNDSIYKARVQCRAGKIDSAIIYFEEEKYTIVNSFNDTLFAMVEKRDEAVLAY